MPIISSVINTFLSLTPRSSTFPTKLEPLDEENDPLVDKEDASSSGGSTERCELKIEGMTCGSCVEVRSASGSYLVVQSLTKSRRLLKEC
jgi:P-type Cu+ transporter